MVRCVISPPYSFSVFFSPSLAPTHQTPHTPHTTHPYTTYPYTTHHTPHTTHLLLLLRPLLLLAVRCVGLVVGAVLSPLPEGEESAHPLLYPSVEPIRSVGLGLRQLRHPITPQPTYKLQGTCTQRRRQFSELESNFSDVSDKSNREPKHEILLRS